MAWQRTLATGALVGSLVCAAVAWADPPCLGDIQKFCAQTPGTAGQIQACLKSHEADLSAGCKAHVDELRRTVADLAGSCVWDIEKFCGDVPTGGGRIAECLQQNRNDLSPVCKDRLGKAAK